MEWNTSQREKERQAALNLELEQNGELEESFEENRSTNTKNVEDLWETVSGTLNTV